MATRHLYRFLLEAIFHCFIIILWCYIAAEVVLAYTFKVIFSFCGSLCEAEPAINAFFFILDLTEIGMLCLRVCLFTEIKRYKS